MNILIRVKQGRPRLSRRTTVWACLLLALASLQPALAQLLPADRLGDWALAGVPGGIPLRTRVIDVTKAPYSADNTGAADAQPAIAAALLAAGDGDVVYLPAGTYRVGAPLYPRSRTTVRGAGMDRTFINFISTWGSAFDLGSESDYLWSVPQVGITGGFAAGSSNLTVASTNQLILGGIIQITEKNSTSASLPVINLSGYERARHQMARVVALKSPTSIAVWPPLLWTLSPGLAPQIARAQLQGEAVGVEDLTINCAGSNSPRAAVWLQQSFGCWVKNVKVKNAHNYSLYIADSVQCEVRGCYMDHAQGAGSNHAGLLVISTSSSLFEDNIVVGLFPSVEVNFGSTGNVFGYNFFHDSTSYGVSGASVDANHGPHNSLNLYEGNVAPTFQADGYFGSSSHDTVFRNWLHGLQPGIANAGWQITLNRFARYYSIVGNILGAEMYPMSYRGMSFGNPNMGNSQYSGTASPLAGRWWADWGKFPGPSGFQEQDQDVVGTTLVKGNYNYFDHAIPATEALGAAMLPNSFYLSAKPAWFGAFNWPPFDPANPGTLSLTTAPRIPAHARFLSGSSAGPAAPRNLRLTASGN